ncbi:hypothetical protein PR001_g12915 [Phytophthora rubi]|uniref:PiggyBac transposable element-derived protein domain-containing protein n=1 Tax=Phytophthora rubi TaxID=129364 RepID=A0A6A3LUV2_9STRA|nr:hypothetical protein PR001_g12915 [Phytophthora rubi]
MWMDRNPVHLLSSGGSRAIGACTRRVDGREQSIAAPELVLDYHRWMGGVDIHDQLRMQRYSVQLSYKTKKYYKTLFLGLLDMTLVNAFIVHRHYREVNNKRPPKHFAFYETLMEQLLAIDSPEAYTAIETAIRAQDRTTSPGRADAWSQSPARHSAEIDTGHRLEENPDTFAGEQGVKRRQRSCKVCALYKVKPRKFTKYYCPECSDGNRRKYLCNVAREGRDKTCFSIWHNDWGNGENIPRLLLDAQTAQSPATIASRQEASASRYSGGGGGEARYSEGDTEQDAEGDEARYSEGDAEEDVEGGEERYSEGDAEQDAEGGEARCSEGDTEQDADEVEERGDDAANVTVL